MSKGTIDYAVCIRYEGDPFKAKFVGGKVSNNLLGYKNMTEDLQRKLKTADFRYVCETTGVYSIPVCNYLQKQQTKITEEQAIKIRDFSKSLWNKGKDDKTDARMIALYGQLRQPKPHFVKHDEILELDRLWTLRRNMMKAKRTLLGVDEAFKFPYTAYGVDFKNKAKAPENLPNSLLINDSLIDEMDSQISKINENIKFWVDSYYKETYDCITSIPHVGHIGAVTSIASTLNFEKFENRKQFLNYAGIVPRSYESGTSVQHGEHVPYSFKCDNDLRVSLYQCGSGAVNQIKKRGSSKNLALAAAYHRIPAHKQDLHKYVSFILANQLARQIFYCGKKRQMFANV